MKQTLAFGFLLIASVTSCDINNFENGEVKWKYPDWHNDFSPSIGPSGTIYFCSGGYLYALNPDGTLKWQDTTNSAFYTPLVTPDETILCISSYRSVIYAVNPDGILKWQSDSIPQNNEISCLAIDASGSIYFAIEDYNSCSNWLYCLYSAGKLKWKKEIDYGTPGDPVIGKDGTIYLAQGRYLYAFDSKGNIKWIYENGNQLTTPAIAEDGTLYVGSGNSLCAISQHATTLWKYETVDKPNLGYTSSPVIGSDGSIYVTSEAWDSSGYIFLSSEIHAIRPSGKVKWVKELSYYDYSSVRSVPAIGKDGTIYIIIDYSGLCAFSKSGDLKWSLEGFSSKASPAISDDGTLYFFGDEALYAIQTSSRGLADSPWPKDGHDNQNTGRAGP
jgi:hypothetical protein